MASFSLSSSSKHPRFDTIVGLDVSGRLYYCRKSTLLAEPHSYFAARFGPDSMMDPQRDRIDEYGREIYFVDRSPDLFGHVLEYLRKRKLPPEMGNFRDRPELWRAMRDESEFYALDGLTALLRVTHDCDPDLDGGRGVLHWLGTDRGREGYVNPYRRGVVDVTGWFDDPTTMGAGGHDPSWGSSEARETFVQHRPMSSRVINEEDVRWPGLGNVYFPCLTGCNHSGERLPVVLDLRKTRVSPTHYSLRYGGGRGMDGSWTFEGSADGARWTVLHRGRRADGHNLTYDRVIARRDALGEDAWFADLLRGEDAYAPVGNWPEAYCDYVERHYRDTFRCADAGGGGTSSSDDDRFFRYLRIVGADPPGPGTGGEASESGGLYCIGLEIYGKVSQD